MIIEPHDHPGMLQVRCLPEESWRMQGAPAKAWNKGLQAWVLPIRPNVQYLRDNFRRSEYTDEAIAAIRDAISEPTRAPSVRLDFPGVPMAHQVQAATRAAGREAFFFAHAMGAGKTYTMIALAMSMYRAGMIDAMVVLCPATIMTDVWEGQIQQWTEGTEVEVCIAKSSTHASTAKFVAQGPSGRMRFLVMSIQAMSSDKGRAFSFARDFMRTHRSVLAVDESSRIKNPKAKRTKNIIELGNYADYRWCATGTKITNGIHDLYSQFRFLDWKIIGHKSYYTFQNRYCRMGGFEGRQIIGYDNVNELLELIGPSIHVIRKEDANDLPPKTYQVRSVEASPEQKKLYAQLANYMEAHDGNATLTVKTMLERMTRYQQLAGGNFPYQDGKEWTTRPVSGTNPKITELLDLLDDTDESVIIWARFVPEIMAIDAALSVKYGADAVVTYYGGTEDRKDAIVRFQGKKARFMVANQATAGMGLTLTAATIAVYYSNSFSYEDRVQSEDRCHRTGQTHPVTYIDLLSDLPIDQDIRRALSEKKSMATFVADKLHSA